MTEYLYRNSTQFEGQESSQGSDCYVVCATIEYPDSHMRRLVKAWVDPNMGWRATKKEVHDPDSGVLLDTTEVDFTEWEEGIWFPSSGTSRSFSQEGALVYTRRVEVKELRKIDEDSDEAFTFAIPSGTLVYDADLNTTFLAE